MYPVNQLRRILSGRKILWVGGGLHLAQPTLEELLCGCIAYSFERNSSNIFTDKDLFINLEDYRASRPDWNRIPDHETFASLPKKFNDKVLKSWTRSVVFPYYVSAYAWNLAEQLGSQVIGNPPLAGESLYLRKDGRRIAKHAGMEVPNTILCKSNQLPDFNDLLSQFSCDQLVITPPYSDGGAWVYPVSTKEAYLNAASDIFHHFSDDFIEITPYYQGISMNVNVCNMYDAEAKRCNVAVYPPSVQIIGDPTLSDKKLRYCGCDFSAASEMINKFDRKKLFLHAVNIGKLLFQKYGWKGFFGIDFIVRPDSSFVFLEINPRLQSSTNILDCEMRDKMNPMLLHIMSSMGENKDGKDIDMTDLPIASSILIAYNNTSNEMIAHTIKQAHPAMYGFSSEEKPVDSGGVLFRMKSKKRVLAADLKTIAQEYKNVVIEQLNTFFVQPEAKKQRSA